MTDTTYQGWRNHATWAVALHINNDEGAQSLVIEWAQECWDEAEESDTHSRDDEAAFALAERIESWVDEMTDEFFSEAPKGWASFLVRDLMDDAADFIEIAKTFIEGVDKDEGPSDEDWTNEP